MGSIALASTKISEVAEQRAFFIAQLLPEAVMAADESNNNSSTSENTIRQDSKYEPFPKPTSVETNPTSGSQGKEGDVPATHPGSEPMYDDGNGEEDHGDAFAKRQIEQEKRQVQSQFRQQKRQIGSLCKKLERLKGATDDIASCQTLRTELGIHEENIKNCQDPEECRDFFQEFYEAEYWNQINDLRQKVELPRELNNIFKNVTRLNKLLLQKSVAKLGLNVDGLQAKVNEWLTLHEEAKSCYISGDFDCARDILEEFQQNSPGECHGAFEMYKRFIQQLRVVKEEDTKQDISDLLIDALEDMNNGDCRSARSQFEMIHREFGPDFWEQFMRRGFGEEGNDDLMRKLEAFRQKFEENFQSHEEREE